MINYQSKNDQKELDFSLFFFNFLRKKEETFFITFFFYNIFSKKIYKRKGANFQPLYSPPKCAQLLSSRVKIGASSRVCKKFPISSIQCIFTLAWCTVFLMGLAWCTFTSFRVCLVGGVEKWEDRKYLVFPHVCLVGRVEKCESGKLFCLVEKKSERIENVVYINWLLYLCYIIDKK